MTKGATTLNVAASDGRDLGEGFVDKIFNIFSINPEGFAMLSPRDQATVLGVDTTDIDIRKEEVYNQRRELGYRVKQTTGALEECGEVEKVEVVGIKALLDRKARLDLGNEGKRKLAQKKREELYREAVTHNKMQDNLQRKRVIHEHNIEALEAKINLLSNEIKTTTAKMKAQKLLANSVERT